MALGTITTLLYVRKCMFSSSDEAQVADPVDINNLVNNISGAFGVFRASFIRWVGGWDAGTAEDLDMTLRLMGVKA